MSHPTVYSYEQGYPINLVGANGQAVQISIHHPSQYIRANRDRLFPDWQSQANFWVVIVLQQSRHSMMDITPEVEAEKQQLRENFMRFGLDVAFNLRDRGYITDLLDPRTGYPLLSRPGRIPHDDAAAVKALLGYPAIQNRCRVLVHPQWGTAIYPSAMISIAPPFMIEWVTKSIGSLHGWN
ncbi:methylmalonic aciduria and homocystinuria type D protein [Calothrix sp. 336/3]|uniref:methylmalonic aciduria and homocystinuria type D protein n=1 Tax=Calothrix sp. 336/3 TaxID=1337936 RepID=UPI0004E36E87|nr:methylmalonic aciduria and homocystinuria type D protein [Calothrix sp. 336/3]AKG23055.1 hypothetical protein IJ00_18885 [Calothrix sp. 336/3]